MQLPVAPAPDPPVEGSYELVVIGAELAALTLVARLPDSLVKNALVIDSTGGWLKRWSEQGDRMQAQHLRTPVTLHPHAKPMALRTFAEKRGRLQELATVSDTFAPVPSARLFADFCAARVVGKLPLAVAGVLRDKVLALVPDSQGVELRLGSGRTLRAQQVVYTLASTQPVLPAWAKQLAASASAGPASAGGSAEDIAQSASRLPPQMLTWDQVDLRTAQLEGLRVVVVGGGMTAASLAAGAADRGARVTLVCRRRLKQQPFACEPGWWGNKRLLEFGQLEDHVGAVAAAVLRLRACWRARGQATIHAPLWGRLVELAAEGRLEVVEGAEVASAAWVGGPEGTDSAQAQGGCWRLQLEPSKAAGGMAATTAQQQPLSEFQAALAAAAAAANGQVPGQLQAPAEVQADAIWVACGSAYHVERDPLLAGLQRQAPAPLVGGYPLLDDATLAWPGAPVLVAGRAAMLSLGPSAGDLGGMRLAADRVVAALRQRWLAPADEPAWVATGRRLGALQLDAAAAAAVPLEEDGAVYEEPRPRASVSRPPHLIDVLDLDPALPRQELQHYKFTDDGFELCVILQLPEAVPLDQVRTKFGERSLEMWAVGARAAYRLHVPQLYGRIIPKRCKAKVNASKSKVFLLLHKESDAEWCFLKG